MREVLDTIEGLLDEPTASPADQEPGIVPAEMGQATRTSRRPELELSTEESTTVISRCSDRFEEDVIPIQETLDEHFTPYERSLLTYADPSTNWSLAQIQTDHHKRYPAFIQTDVPVDHQAGDPWEEEWAGKDTVQHTQEVPLGISLRGGGLDDGLDDESDGSVDDNFIQSQLRLEGVEDIVNQFVAEDELGELDIDINQLFEVMGPLGISRRGGKDTRRSSTDLSSPTHLDSPRPKTSRGDTGKRPSVHFASDPDPPSPRHMTSWARTPLRPVREEGSSAGESSATAPTDHDVNNVPLQKVPGDNHNMRQKSYADPMPSVRTKNQTPAAALQKVVQFDSDTIPTMSTGVMTPTEQRRLQIAYYTMRNIALERGVQCPYAGCERVFAVAEEARLQKHLEDAHLGDGCNFCDDVLWKSWSKNQRRAHFLRKHRNLFLTDPQWKADNSFNVPSLFRVDWERESRYSFCPRCGRDHRALDAHADRTHHDNVCYPGSDEGQYDWTACADCGGKKWPKSEHHCQGVINPNEPPYCSKCALPAGLFSDLYRASHHLHCQGHNNEAAKFCPWCGQSCGRDVVENALKHMTNCAERPDNQAQGPLNPDTATPWPSLLEYNPKHEGPGIHKDPPAYCTECKQAVFHLDAHLLMKHIEDNHEDKLDHCIFCKLDYKPRGWLNNRQAKVLHLDDHIHERKQTLATDLVQSRLWPPGHPYTKRKVDVKDLEKLQVLRALQHKDEQLANLRERNHALVAELNEDKASIEMLRSQVRLQHKETRRQSRHDLHHHSRTQDTPVASRTPKPRSQDKESRLETGAPPARDRKGKGKQKDAPITESVPR